jgi:hypothetical protein
MDAALASINLQRVCLLFFFFVVERATFGGCVGRVAWSFTRRPRHLAPLTGRGSLRENQLQVFLAAGGCFLKPRAASICVQWARRY